jgi:hypothetical protein
VVFRVLKVSCHQPKQVARETGFSLFQPIKQDCTVSRFGRMCREWFAGSLTVALYVVTDMEYPRLGLIRIEAFDHFLKDAYDQMR